MSKRFTDTGKWKKESFAGLSLKMKLVWIFLCDDCDHAGIWDINLRLLSFHIGESVTLAEIIHAFGDKILHLEIQNKLFVAGFVEFQYGKLNPENRVHRSVLDRLHKVGVKPLVSPLLGLYQKSQAPAQGAKDKDKDKDKEQDKDERFQNFEDMAEAVLRMIALYGDWSKSEAEVRDDLGDRAFDLARRAGTHRIRMLPANAWTKKTVAGMLRDASNQGQLFQTVKTQITELSR